MYKKIIVSSLVCMALFTYSQNFYATGIGPLEELSKNVQIIPSEKIEEGEAGTYPIIYKYYDQNGHLVAEDTQYITLTYQKTIVNYELAEAIDARDVTMTTTDFWGLTDQNIMVLTSGKAWELQTGTSIPITKIERKEINKYLYEVTLYTARNTHTTVVIRMQDEVVDANTVYLTPTTLQEQMTEIISLSVIIVSAPLFLFGFVTYTFYEKNKVEKLLYKKE